MRMNVKFLAYWLSHTKYSVCVSHCAKRFAYILACYNVIFSIYMCISIMYLSIYQYIFHLSLSIEGGRKKGRKGGRKERVGIKWWKKIVFQNVYIRWLFYMKVGYLNSYVEYNKEQNNIHSTLSDMK